MGRVRTVRAAAAVVLGALACSCVDPTQIVVVVDSDMAVPSDLDAFRARVIGLASGSDSGLFPEGQVPGIHEGRSALTARIARQILVALDAPAGCRYAIVVLMGIT